MSDVAESRYLSKEKCRLFEVQTSMSNYINEEEVITLCQHAMELYCTDESLLNGSSLCQLENLIGDFIHRNLIKQFNYHKGLWVVVVGDSFSCEGALPPKTEYFSAKSMYMNFFILHFRG